MLVLPKIVKRRINIYIYIYIYRLPPLPPTSPSLDDPIGGGGGSAVGPIESLQYSIPAGLAGWHYCRPAGWQGWLLGWLAASWLGAAGQKVFRLKNPAAGPIESLQCSIPAGLAGQHGLKLVEAWMHGFLLFIDFQGSAAQRVFPLKDPAVGPIESLQNSIPADLAGTGWPGICCPADFPT